jgi:hypothetical protein
VLTVNKLEVSGTVNKAGQARLVLVVNCSDAEFVQGELALEQKLKKGERFFFDAVPGVDCTGTDQVRVINLTAREWKPGKATVIWDIPTGRVIRQIVLRPAKG